MGIEGYGEVQPAVTWAQFLQVDDQISTLQGCGDVGGCRFGETVAVGHSTPYHITRRWGRRRGSDGRACLATVSRHRRMRLGLPTGGNGKHQNEVDKADHNPTDCWHTKQFPSPHRGSVVFLQSEALLSSGLTYTATHRGTRHAMPLRVAVLNLSR